MKEILLVVIILFSFISYGQVRVYEAQEEIPTYKMGKDVASPIFYTGRGVQGAAGHMYPYPAQTNLGEELTLETYNMVYMENEYLKVSILPEFGGRLFSAIDKTNGRELFHRNSVIKPDLIGTLGAWISGGIEWCFPHHHRTTTLMPADYKIIQNEDESITVWVGETERDLRLRGIIGITLRPGRSYIEVEYRLNNTNTVTKNFLFWANVAVTADDNFRTFWPPNQEIGVFHSNSSFTHWPISNEVYNGIDYTSGVDLTWWKNHPNPVSFFFWQGKGNFVGGYDYSENAGTIHVGDVTENRTSKLWQFGPGLLGQNARRKLTDDGRAYVELMTGTFSNNQPGYGWFVPHSVKVAKNYWYPIRELDIVKKANTNASASLQLKEKNLVFYGFNTTKLYTDAEAVLKYGDEVLKSERIDIDPSKPYTSTFQSTKEFTEEQLFVELLDRDGNQLVSYRPYKTQNPELPDAQEAPKPVEELKSVEDLYLTGRFVEQFSRPGLNPDDYYLKALEISPDDYRVNLALGIRRLNQWRYEEAEMFLEKAAKKLRVNYYQPKEGELFYYLGLVQKSLGKLQLAEDNFSKSTWYYQWRSSGFYQMALLQCNEGNYSKALEYLEKASMNNQFDNRILLLQTALLRKLNRNEEALVINKKQIKFDPIFFAAYYERYLITNENSLIGLRQNMQDLDNNYLEIATNYLNSGLLNEGIALLSSLENPGNPLVYYYLASFYAKKEQPEKAQEQLHIASTKSIDYCFPYREESIEVLQYAIENFEKNAIPNYLLGNLIYDRIPNRALAAWNNALKSQEDFAMVWRNLAFGAFYHETNIDKAIEFQKKAIELDGNQPIWYSELQTYYMQSDKDLNDCLAILTANIETVKKDINAPKGLVNLYNLTGKYDEAIKLLDAHHFRTWELGKGIHFHYVDAHTLKALELMKQGKNEFAIMELEKAMEYPENLEVGKPLDDGRNAMIYYFMGLAYEKLGRSTKAQNSFMQCIDSNNSRNWPDLPYYQAQSHMKMGNTEEANKIFMSLIEEGKKLLEREQEGVSTGVEESANDAESKSEAYYLKALGSLGLKNKKEADILFKQARKTYKNNLWVNAYSDSFVSVL